MITRYRCGRTIVLALLLAATPVSSALAVDINDAVRINGFYGLDLTYADEDVGLPSSSGAARYEADSPSLDASIIGAQLDFDLGQRLSLTLQGVGFQNIDDHFTTRMDWAYLSYDLGADTRLRAGKLQIPLLQGTELRAIGFSRLWARPMVPNNGAGGFLYFEGGELLKHVSAESGDWDFQVSVGKPEHDLAPDVDGEQLQLVAARYSRGDSWLRAVAMYSEYGLNLPGEGGRQVTGQEWIYGLEGETRLGNLVVTAGATDGETERIPVDRLAYLSLGYAVGPLTPYITGAYREMEFEALSSPTAGAPAHPRAGPGPAAGAGPGGPPAGPREGIARTLSGAVGVRMFLGEQVSLKAQWEYTETDDRTRQRAGDVREQDARVFSVVLEGVF